MPTQGDGLAHSEKMESNKMRAGLSCMLATIRRNSTMKLWVYASNVSV